MRSLTLTGCVLVLAACGGGLPQGVQVEPEALRVSGWDGLDRDPPEIVVRGTARDSVLSLLRQHSDATGVPLRDYWAETEYVPDESGPPDDRIQPWLLFSHSEEDHELLRQAAERWELGRDTVLVPVGYHSLIVTLNPAADSVTSVWSHP